jgi:hypothetical protein
MINSYHFDKTPEDVEREREREREAPAEDLANAPYFASSESIDLQHNYLIFIEYILYNNSV